MSKKLQEIIDNAEIIQRSFTEPTSILVTDKKQILIQVKADFDTTNIPAGTLLETMPNDIRRMADQSKASTSNIIKYLEKVNEAVNKNNLSIQEIATMAEEQSETLAEFRRSFDVIGLTADQFLKAAEIK
ncbi:MAG TPA: hypothetical protein VNQ57_07565 [Ureibacillus sp.]|nr:hypothetical protein [Ureibacillus sp.]